MSGDTTQVFLLLGLFGSLADGDGLQQGCTWAQDMCGYSIGGPTSGAWPWGLAHDGYSGRQNRFPDTNTEETQPLGGFRRSSCCRGHLGWTRLLQQDPAVSTIHRTGLGGWRDN